MRPRSRVVETVWRPRATGRQTGGPNASTSVNSRRRVAGKNSRDLASELCSSTPSNHSRNSIRRRPFNSVGFLCVRGSTRYGLRATDVEARQNRTLQYLRALIAVNLRELTSSARSTTRASAIASEALSSSSDAGARPMPLAVMARGCDRTCVAAGSAGHDEVAASSASASGYIDW
jgi:hypothetical protein